MSVYLPKTFEWFLQKIARFLKNNDSTVYFSAMRWPHQQWDGFTSRCRTTSKYIPQFLLLMLIEILQKVAESLVAGFLRRWTDFLQKKHFGQVFHLHFIYKLLKLWRINDFMYVQIRNRFWEFCRTKFPEKNQDHFVKVFYFLLGVIKEEEKGGDTSSIYHI